MAALVLVGVPSGASAGPGTTVSGSAPLFEPVAVTGPPTAVVTLGDSYSSGLGAGGYTNDCDNTPRAWGNIIFGTAVTQRAMLACSGATIPTVTSQVQRIPSLPIPAGGRLITVTVGGNDAGFASELRNCLTSFFACTRRESDIANRINGLHGRLVTLYRAIKAAAPGDQVIVGGYPMLVPDPSVRSNCSALTGFISSSERRMIRRLGALLNDVIERAAAEAGVRSAGDQVVSAFNGHEACSNSSNDWLFGLRISFSSVDGAPSAETPATEPSDTVSPQAEIIGSFVRDSFHPTQAGQAGYARSFESAWFSG